MAVMALMTSTMPLCAKVRVLEDLEDIPVGDLLYSNKSETPDFVIRWEYQQFCDHVYDPRIDIWRWPTDREQGVTFDTDKVKPGDIIFVRDIPKFFKEMHPYIPYPYIILTAGECLDKMEKDYVTYLDEPKVIAWYGIHANDTAMKHPKFRPIPLGILQRPAHHKKKERYDNYFAKLRKSTKKNYLVYMNFADFQKPERQKLKKMMEDKPYCKQGDHLEFRDYLKQMAESIFTLSPKGLGPDCYRTWEALLVGSIPIVKTSPLDPLYEGLPVLIVDKWTQVNEEFLRKKYKEIASKKYDIARLYTHYWTKKMKKERKAFLKTWKTR
jgi:hypothetical protein